MGRRVLLNRRENGSLNSLAQKANDLFCVETLLQSPLVRELDSVALLKIDVEMNPDDPVLQASTSSIPIGGIEPVLTSDAGSTPASTALQAVAQPPCHPICGVTQICCPAQKKAPSHRSGLLAIFIPTPTHAVKGD